MKLRELRAVEKEL